MPPTVTSLLENSLESPGSAVETVGVNLCPAHVSTDSPSLFTPTRKTSSPASSPGGCSATRRSREGAVWVFQMVPHCPHFFSPNLEMSPQEAGRDPKLRSDLVEGMG